MSVQPSARRTALGATVAGVLFGTFFFLSTRSDFDSTAAATWAAVAAGLFFGISWGLLFFRAMRGRIRRGDVH